ncbi:MAG: MurR/RpiR family transcriptional regulator [Actinobacteria bacterium]|nr:MurR/RpiR family transcriptional regulator [Actinomycetota bacterium]
MDVADRIVDVQDRLPPAERRVAEVVLADPSAVAFGTVAEIAKRGQVSGPSVVRLANRLGFSGFAEMQDAIRDEIGQRLRPAAERIRERPVHDTVGRTHASAVENVAATLDGIDADAYRVAVSLLAARSRAVHVLAGDATYGVAHLLATSLGMLRPGVGLVSGSDVAVARAVAHMERGDVLVAIDLRRYERWVVDALQVARASGSAVIAITDSRISPLAEGAAACFVVAAASPGPFDSHVGTLALADALVAGVAGRLRRSATARLDQVEEAWRRSGALLDG